MVVLMEEFGGLSLKRKGADEPELFDVGGDDRSVFPLSCRATKMRRIASTDFAGVQGHADLPMGDAAASLAVEGEKAMVLIGGGASDAVQSAPRLRPCGAAVRDGADWVLRAMLREADSRTVRELLAAAGGQGGGNLALAVVPWVPPSPAAEETAGPVEAEEVVDDEGDGDGAAAMEVEEDEGQAHQWTTRQTAVGGEGFVYRWPQHCMAPPQLPVVGLASPVMWSW